MTHNVGENERLIRLALGAGAGAASLRAHGWRKAVLGGIATSSVLTGLTRYCPVNAALGVGETNGSGEHDRSVRDTEVRRQTQTSAAMGQLAGTSIDTSGSTR